MMSGGVGVVVLQILLLSVLPLSLRVGDNIDALFKNTLLKNGKGMVVEESSVGCLGSFFPFFFKLFDFFFLGWIPTG